MYYHHNKSPFSQGHWELVNLIIMQVTHLSPLPFMRYGPFKTYLSQNSLSKHNPTLKMKTSLEVLSIIYPHQEPTSVWHCRYKKWELDGWLSILHIVIHIVTCTIYFMHKFSMSFVFHFYIFGSTSWIWTNPSTEWLIFESPFKMKLMWGLQSWPPTPTRALEVNEVLVQVYPVWQCACEE